MAHGRLVTVTRAYRKWSDSSGGQFRIQGQEYWIPWEEMTRNSRQVVEGGDKKFPNLVISESYALKEGIPFKVDLELLAKKKKRDGRKRRRSKSRM